MASVSEGSRRRRFGWLTVTLSLVVAACGSDATQQAPSGAGTGGQGGSAGKAGGSAGTRAGTGGTGRSSGGAGGAAGDADGGAGEGGSGADVAAGRSGAGRSGAGRGNAGAGGESGAAGGEGGSGGSEQSAKFRITLAPAELSLPRGASAWIGVTVERAPDFDGAVEVSFEELPDGWTSDTLALPGAVTSGILPVFASTRGVDGEVELEAVASSGAQRARGAITVAVVPPEASSQEKIRAALVAGTIDYETSLRYRAFALWGDARLPEEFWGSGSEEEDNLLFDELFERLEGLSAPAQADLRPFVVRPHAPDSIFNAATVAKRAGAALPALVPGNSTSCPPQSSAAGAWISRRGADPVRVWAQCTGQPAADAESERLVDRTLALLDKIYGPMTSLMTAPIEDQEGPDTAIDFYVVDGAAVSRRGELFRPQGLGSTYSDYPEVGSGASGFVLLPRSLLYTSRFHTTLIHEFFHVIAKAYNHTYAMQERSASNVYEAHWFPEAAAVWASAHFDRTLAPWDGGRGAYLDAHRRFGNHFLPSPLALTAPEPVPHTYAAYIWPYFVEQETESANFMPQIWEGLMNVSSWDAADDAISAPLPFQEHFKDFALRNLNSEFSPGDPLPEGERYVALDELFPDGTMPPLVTATLTADQEFREALPLANLSARYVLLEAGASVRKVELDFADLQPGDLVDVRALVETDDGWLPEPLELSDESRAVFCFDDGPTTASVRGSFSNVLLVISNHGVRSDSNVSGELVVRPESEPCAPVWQGTVTMSYRSPVTLGEVTESSTAAVVFEFDDTMPASRFETLYRLRSGTYTYDWLGDYSARNPPCQTLEVASGTMLPESVPSGMDGGSVAQLVLQHFDTPSTYLGQGLTYANVHMTSNCNDQNEEQTLDYLKTFAWLQTGPLPLEVSEDGRTIEGTFEAPDGGGGVRRFDWSFVRVDE